MLLPQGIDILVGMLGVIKAGAAYLLLDINDNNNLAYTLNDAKPSIVLSQAHLISQVSHFADGAFELDAQWDEVCRESVQNLGAQVYPETLAYVTYGFAFAGDPKGVAVQHGNVTAMVRWAQAACSAGELTRVFTSNPSTSNLSMLDTYVPLCYGGTVVSGEGSIRAASTKAGAGVTLINSTPSAMREFVRTNAVPHSVRTVNIAGEAVCTALIQKIYEGTEVQRVVNLYGSPGSPCYCIAKQLQFIEDDKSARVPIGRPVAGTQALVLDEHMEVAPVGMFGQLYVAGMSVARGYFRRPDATADHFLPNPFGEAGGERLYRTGDLARYSADGELEVRSRVDCETRIRNHRIDLTEIENALQRLPEVADALVLVQQPLAAEGQLAAYIIPQNPESFTSSTLERLPLCFDGTLDRSALPVAQEKFNLTQTISLPGSDTEKTVAAIWKQVLKVEEIGIEDNFFEAGGHSLLVPEVLSALQQAFGTNLELVELLQYPTIRSLSERLDSERVTTAQPLAPAIDAEIGDREQPILATKGFAVIGMACRFPGARNIQEFWNNLREGVESVVEFSDEDFRKAGVAEAVFTSSDYVKYGAIIEDVDLFDARFFNLSAREAELIDPQQRVLLEIAWEALEDAGYASEIGRGRVGVYAGSGPPTYLLNQHLDHKVMHPNDATPLLFANAADFLATRVAYKLNLTGPGITIQAACSTSLVTAHMACRALMNGECDLAVAGGVTIRTPQVMGDSFMEGGITSPDGHTRTFDERAQGMVRANGAGVIVIKRLADAIRDRDCIHAIIRGSAINNDGSQKVSYAAPSIIGQRDVIEQALRDSEVDPGTISYVETHGTATPLGDPIEISALTQAFRVSSSKKAYCAVGSVKSNIGHTDCAAGVSGIIKTILSLEHKQIPATLHYERPNPKIDFVNSPFYVNTSLSEWKTNGGPRRAGVSSFGIGGTNAHIVLEEALPVESCKETRPYQMLVISAKTNTALEAVTTNLSAYLESHRDVSLADVAYTLHLGRREFNHRRTVIGKDMEDAVAALRSSEPKRVFTGIQEPKSRPVVFMFSGQGSQYVNMARGLYETESVFEQEIDHCSAILQEHRGFDLRDVLYPKRGEVDISSSATQLLQTKITQPALFVIEYALARLWMEWGIQPKAMVGHSIGEYVAACLAGVFSLEDALTLVSARGKLMQALPPGTMLVVPLAENEVTPLLGDELSLAAVNSHDLSVVSGPEEDVSRLELQLTAKNLAGRRLQTSHAFHSAMMDPILEPFASEVRKIQFNAPKLQYLSNLTGTWITEAQATSPEYWVRHLRGTVRFADCVSELTKDPDWMLLEVGPGQTLTTLARRNPNRSQKQIVVNSVRHPNDSIADEAFLLGSAGKLWIAGARFDWSGFYAHEQRKRLALPTYPFERERYWLEPQKETASSLAPSSTRRNSNLDEWFYLPSWKRTPLTSATAQEGTGPWLIFCDRFGFETQLRDEAQRRGIEIFSVAKGSQYVHTGDSFTVRPEEALDYQLVFKDLEKTGKLPSKLIYLWTLTDGVNDTNGTVQDDLNASFLSPLFLAQAIGSLANAPQIEWIIVSNYLYDVIGELILHPLRATALSYCRVVPQEYSNVSCRNVDLDFSIRESATAEPLYSSLVEEVIAGSKETVVAYRRGRRWSQIFERQPLPVSDQSAPLRPGGTYLITGGLGGVGLTIAEHLAKTAEARLALIGRSPFPPREKWQGWVDTHSEEDETSTKIRKLRAIEGIGAKVLVLIADVSDEPQMQSAVIAAQQHFGPIHGVVHCAGVPGGGLIQLKTPAAAESVLAPKVRGTMVLASVLAKMPLDFFVACSSLRSIAGAFGQIDYCAANAFLDAFAHYSRQNGACPMVAINWDGWAGLGMLAKSAGAAGAYLEKAEQGLSAGEGVEALMRILRLKSQPQVIVSTRDIDALLLQTRNSEKLTEILAQAATPVAAGSRHPRPAIDVPYQAPGTPIEHKIAEIWQQVLGVDQVGIHDNIFDLGGDSVQSIQIAAKVSQQGFQCTPELVFRHQTVAELASVAAASHTTQSTSEESGGAVPLTPVQLRFFEQNHPVPEHHNQSILLDVPANIDTNRLREAISLLIDNHDVLTARFDLSVPGWRHESGRTAAQSSFSEVDLSELNDTDRSLEFDREVARLQSSLNLAQGPVFRTALFSFGQGTPGRLLLIAHSLVSDRSSMIIMADDLNLFYQRLLQNEEIQFPEKHAGYQHWARKLREVVTSPDIREQFSEWANDLRFDVPDLPVDLLGGNNDIQSASNVLRSLDREETRSLLEDISTKHRASVHELLLTALARSLSSWTAVETLLVDVEHDGRRDFVPELDVSRTVGAFAESVPVLLRDLHPEDLNLTLKSVKEQARRIQKYGLGYGLLRYVNGDPELGLRLSSMPQFQIRFSYHEGDNEKVQSKEVFTLLAEPVAHAYDPRTCRSYLFEVTTLVLGGKLQLTWTYSRTIHTVATAEMLADRFMETLRSLIAPSASAESASLTPSDFPLAGLDEKGLLDLEYALAEADELEDNASGQQAAVA
jgi:amino acid adenylation domain-containing protein/non-ribosomal peptide synthase protein (TIGR01720 family)